MAEPTNRAFGRYLKMLRERRRLSLDDVASATGPYPDPVGKGHLSRVENGKAGIAFSKVIAIARALDVSLDVIAERYSLDQELEKQGGGPDTAGKSYAELRAAAKKARERGRKWDAYGYIRDALRISAEGVTYGEGKIKNDDLAHDLASVASMGLGLGRLRFALFELDQLLLSVELTQDARVATLQQLAVAHVRLRDFAKAEAVSESALAIARESSPSLLGFACGGRAFVAHRSGDARGSLRLYQEAYRHFRSAADWGACATTQLNIAQAYFDIGGFRAARRSSSAALGIAEQHGVQNVQSRARILLGELEQREGRHAAAGTLWRQALAIAKRSNDTVVAFKAEFQLYRQAVNLGDDVLRRALARRLHRLAPWIPTDTAELAEFHDLYSSQPPHVKRRGRVAAKQRTAAANDNR